MTRSTGMYRSQLYLLREYLRFFSYFHGICFYDRCHVKDKALFETLNFAVRFKKILFARMYLHIMYTYSIGISAISDIDKQQTPTRYNARNKRPSLVSGVPKVVLSEKVHMTMITFYPTRKFSLSRYS